MQLSQCLIGLERFSAVHICSTSSSNWNDRKALLPWSECLNCFHGLFIIHSSWKPIITWSTLIIQGLKFVVLAARTHNRLWSIIYKGVVPTRPTHAPLDMIPLFRRGCLIRLEAPYLISLLLFDCSLWHCLCFVLRCASKIFSSLFLEISPSSWMTTTSKLDVPYSTQPRSELGKLMRYGSCFVWLPEHTLGAHLRSWWLSLQRSSGRIFVMARIIEMIQTPYCVSNTSLFPISFYNKGAVFEDYRKLPVSSSVPLYCEKTTWGCDRRS